jgi:hypothetical protein
MEMIGNLVRVTKARLAVALRQRSADAWLVGSAAALGATFGMAGIEVASAKNAKPFQ